MRTGWTRARWTPKILTVGGVLALFAVLYFAVPPVRSQFNRALTLLSTGDVHALKTYLLSFGLWAPVISALLMILQAIIAPLPAFLITMANGMLFGTLWGGLLSWASALVAALVCFFIANALGRPVVERFVSKRGLHIADHFFESYGKYAVLVARFIPVVPFDPISFGAGLTKMPLRDFALATGIGIIPATIIYASLGENMGSKGPWLWAAVAISVLLAGSLTLRVILRRRFSSDDGPPVQMTRPM
ncbi:MAG: TVP38/TMEM64 family protein [Nitrospinota bacterium]